LAQNFDVVQVAVGEDTETAARTFRARADVDYAQAAYRVHADQATFVPNDKLYPKQWNLPLIDMERALVKLARAVPGRDVRHHVPGRPPFNDELA